MENVTTDKLLLFFAAVALVFSCMHPGWHLAFVFSVCAISSVASQILVPSKNMVKKEELADLYNALKVNHDQITKEITEIKIVVADVVTQSKATSTKLSGLRMKIGLKD